MTKIIIDHKAIGDTIMQMNLQEIRELQEYLYETYSVGLTIVAPLERTYQPVGVANANYAIKVSSGS